MNLFGPHIQKPGMGLDLLERWKPTAALVMDVDSEYIRRARACSPATVLVVRVFEEGARFLDWPPETWVGRLLAKFPAEKPDYFVTINEPFGQNDTALFARFDKWQAEVIRLLQQAGTDGLANCFGTGNFTGGADRIKIPDVFPRTCQVANAMGPHDYSWPTMADGWGWYCGRWFKWYDDIKAATGKEMKFIIGECGLTQAVIAGRPDHGWQSSGLEGVTRESYLATLDDYLHRVVKWDNGRGIVLGLCLFNFYDLYHWSFEHVGQNVIEPIMEMDALVENKGGNGMASDIKVLDRNYNEKDLDWARSKYGIAFRRANVEPGQKVYRLVELWEKRGPAALVTNVTGLNGEPLPDVDVALYWSSAPEPPEPATEAYPHDWYPNFVHGLTNANGDVGPGMGKGAYIGEGECGPHAVWVRDPNVPSDICECLGMLAGTPHDHLDQKFQLVVEGQENPPAVEPFVLVNQVFQPQGSNQIVITATGEQNFYGVQAAMWVGEIAFEPVQPETLREFILTTDYVPPEGETSRTFVVQLQWQNGTPLSPKWECVYLTGSNGRWVLQVQEESGSPPPEPPPVSGWTMNVERDPAPGLRLLVGSLPEAGVPITVTSAWSSVSVISGSKPEYGPGGFEVTLWSSGVYAISFLDQGFEVRVDDDEIVRATFTTGQTPGGQKNYRIVSVWLTKDEAVELLTGLDIAGFKEFEVEERQ